VRLVNRVEGEGGSDVTEALTAMEAGWRPHLVALRLHLAGHPGEEPQSFEVTRPAGGTLDEAWRTMLDGIGADAGVEQGAELGLPGSGAPRSVVEHAGEHEAVLRLTGPTPGYALLAVFEGGDGPLASIRVWRYGPGAEGVAAGEQAAWEEWARERFPAGA
jgi:hypothetical protein